MRKTLATISAVLLLSPLTAHAQDGRVTLDVVAKAMGADGLKSLEITASGANSFRSAMILRSVDVAPPGRAAARRVQAPAKTRACSRANCA